jgi:cellulose synthase/poly-beta-1,6-N-acetylglucosamine synthase-like glycosyltransferase
VIVVSDASTDGTNEIVRRFADAGVRLLIQETRRGKTDGLNRAMALARGEIVLFTDANASYLPDTIQRIVNRFVDRRVGMVTGYTRYRISGEGNISEATNLYTSLERLIKRAESAWGCCVGADGAVFAVRRTLYRPLRQDDINDFVIPLRVIEQGYACVLAEEAYCTELPGKTLESEFRRQSRITNRTLRALFRNAHLLNPLRFPVFAFFLWSHKLVRFLVPPLLVLSAVSLLFLFPRGGLYGLGALVGGLVMFVIALSRSGGAVAQSLPGAKFVRLIDVFVTTNVAVLHGWWKFAAGRADITWQHDRSPA